MKLKVRPEDFVVMERADLPLNEKGNYSVYLLTKRGFNTVDLLMRLSKGLKIPYHRFSYGGKKDRYALTSQYITIEGTKVKDISEKNFTLKYLGNMDRPMGPDLIVANEFRITVRDLKEEEVEKATEEIEYVKEYGFPNYFDDQRFGSYSKEQGFIAEKILKGHYNGALKIYLTAIHPEDKREEKERKRFFFEKWGEWDACLERAKTGIEKRIFRTLLNEKERPFLKALQTIPAEELSLFFSAFQSYIWNRIAEGVVRIYGGELLRYRGNYWEYLFYRKPEAIDYLKELIIPTPDQKSRMPDELTDQIFRDILAEFGLRQSSFNLRKVRKAFFKSVPRALVVIPEVKEVSQGRDEIYSGKILLYLHFKLPRGSYGTMFIKRLMAG